MFLKIRFCIQPGRVDEMKIIVHELIWCKVTNRKSLFFECSHRKRQIGNMSYLFLTYYDMRDGLNKTGRCATTTFNWKYFKVVMTEAKKELHKILNLISKRSATNKISQRCILVLQKSGQIQPKRYICDVRNFLNVKKL